MSKQQRKPSSSAGKPPAQKPNRSFTHAHSATDNWQSQTPSFFNNMLLQSGLIFAFAFLLYANTLMHGFVLDDAIVITDNMFTQQGIKGIGGILSNDTFFGFFKVEGKETLVSGGRYRPMTLVLFAFLYQLSTSPFIFHLFTVLLFALTCVVLYRTLLRLLSPPLTVAQQRGDPSPAMLAQAGPMIAWLATVLFAAHPIHTEVVANIKGCDEILTLLGCLSALYFSLKAWDTQETRWALAAGVSFFIACLSKENAAAFVILIPLALWFFRFSRHRLAEGGRPDPSPAGRGGQSVLRASLPIFVAFVAFFLLRGTILHWRFGGEPMELMNNPFLKLEGNQWVKFAPAERLATIFYTLGRYVQLLFVPHPLTHDYYPRQIGIMTFGNPMVLFSVALYGFMAYWAVRGISRRDPSAYGILLYLLPLGIVSNLVFPIGTNMGERFAFMPSVGFCFLIALFLGRYLKNNRSLVLGLFGAVVLLFSIKTFVRNFAWQSNENLFMTDAAVSVNSAKLQNACGGVLFDRATKEKDSEKQRVLCMEAMPHLDQAIKIYPNYKDAYISRGGAHYVLREFPEAIADYRRAVQLEPNDPKLKTYLALALRDGGKYFGEQKADIASAFKCFEESWQLNPKDPETARLMGVGYGISGKHAEAIVWFTKAVEAAPKEAGFLWDLSLAYSASGNTAKGEELRKKAMEMDPTIAQKRSGGGR
ncbi:MAG: tetratricopeptide repeat protein [Phycisphaerae bacterium]|nr:tetratricopeptide repeat protein [Saprospiraceae bacterium]